MKRLSITLTDGQAAALERIAAETGATKQSMIGLAISDWVRVHDYPEDEPKTPQNHRRTWWYGCCRTYSDAEGSRDRDRRRFDTEHDAIMHAKAVAAEYKAKGYTVLPLWEECDEWGIPLSLVRST